MSTNVHAIDSVLCADEETREDSVIQAADEGHVRVRVLHRDPADIITIRSLSFASLLTILLLLTSVAGNIYLYYKGPMLVIKNPENGRILQINDRVFGGGEPVKYGPDHLTSSDKQYLASEFSKNLYQIDPATRPKDIERALQMMVPTSALILARYFKQQGTLEKQRAESWQTVWRQQDISIDRADPYTVGIIGRQEITKLVNNAREEEFKQLKLTIKLLADPRGRADRNLRSGFLIASIDCQELALSDQSSRGAQARAVSTSASDTTNTTSSAVSTANSSSR
jgi:hypothetical protein